MEELDLLEVLKQRVEEADVGVPVCLTAPSSQKVNECVVLSFGTPRSSETYYDLTEDIPVRITVICKRISELDAMQNATSIRDSLTYGSLDSENGSYEVTDLEMTRPRPMPWDESGRFVWLFEINLSMERNIE